MEEIEDVRISSDFKGTTFSKFKKTDVRKELMHAFMHSKLEMACYWCAELICAGHYGDIWELIITFYTKHVHFGNIKMAPYLDLRMNQFKGICANGYSDNLLQLRNHPRIRALFCEIICALCYSKQRHSFDIVKITKEDFDVLALREKFKAPSNEYAETLFMEEDPKELFPAINEFAYHISEGRNIMFACYWLEWMMEFETLCKAKKEKINCERRIFAKVDVKYQKDIIWMIWDVLLTEAKTRSKFVHKIMESLLSLFGFSYSSGCQKKKRYLLYFAISLVCETTLDTNEEIIHPTHQEEIANILANVHLFYRQIKKNEEKPEMDYLYQGMKSTNFESTLSKLEQMDNMGESFIPRIG
jgi:hypothetical protein